MRPYLLVVESDADLQRRLGEALRDGPYEVAAETEVSWAKRSISVRTPDAVILDTSLSDATGFALADELRRDPETRATPLVFLASRRFRGANHRAVAVRRYAPAAFLSSPAELGHLRAQLDAIFAPASTSPAATRHDTDPDQPVPTQPAMATATPDERQRREKRDVERTAKSLESADADLRGTLKRTPFARLLQRLFARRVTGSLLLMRDTTKKIVSFANGYPVSVRSNVLGECLGQILLQQRLISNEALQESLRRMKAENRQQGELLVEMGGLSPYNLSRALVEQLEAKLFEVFSWPDGQYMFKQGDAPEGDALKLDRSPAALILEGIRRHYLPERQTAVLDAYRGKYVALNPDPVLRLQEVTSDPAEQRFIQDIDGRTRLETVIDSARISREKALLLLVALSQAGMIEPADAPTRRPATPVPTTAVDLTSEPGAIPTTGLGTSALLSFTQLGLVAQTVRAQNHYWALGVRPEDPADAIDQAYEALARSFHPDRYRQRPDEDRRLAQEIFDRLAEAHRVLHDPARRKAYETKLERHRGNDHPAIPAQASGPVPSGAAKEIYDAGMQHLRANRHREAVEAFRQAARMLPDQADFRAALGWALFREAPADARAGRAARAELLRAIQLDPKNHRARDYLGHLYAQSGQADLAITEFEKLLELDPSASDVAEEIRRLRESR
jgi:DNA-binding response OmpR family regulator/tetratricopeptide (TPR) repeat protein